MEGGQPCIAQHVDGVGGAKVLGEPYQGGGGLTQNRGGGGIICYIIKYAVYESLVDHPVDVSRKNKASEEPCLFIRYHIKIP